MIEFLGNNVSPYCSKGQGWKQSHQRSDKNVKAKWFLALIQFCYKMGQSLSLIHKGKFMSFRLIDWMKFFITLYIQKNQGWLRVNSLSLWLLTSLKTHIHQLLLLFHHCRELNLLHSLFFPAFFRSFSSSLTLSTFFSIS